MPALRHLQFESRRIVRFETNRIVYFQDSQFFFQIVYYPLNKFAAIRCLVQGDNPLCRIDGSQYRDPVVRLYDKTNIRNIIFRHTVV